MGARLQAQPGGGGGARECRCTRPRALRDCSSHLRLLARVAGRSRCSELQRGSRAQLRGPCKPASPVRLAAAARPEEGRDSERREELGSKLGGARRCTGRSRTQSPPRAPKAPPLNRPPPSRPPNPQPWAVPAPPRIRFWPRPQMVSAPIRSPELPRRLRPRPAPAARPIPCPGPREPGG